VPRHNGDLTKVKLFPPCPPGLAALESEWHRLAALVPSGNETRPNAAQVAAIIERRIREGVALLK